MVLVRGGPERLGDVVRRVVELSPGADVLVRADALASLAPESTVVLRLRREDFDWLNIARPVVLGHRVVLFGDAATALALEQQSFDFHDWISHRIDAPAGAPTFSVRALRDAACARSPAIVWRGGDIDAAFSEALPGRALVRVSAVRPYVELVDALRPKRNAWALVTDLDDALRVQRARWAAAEAGRYGRTILVESGSRIDGLPVAHASLLALDDAAARLSAAGIEHGARLAALLDLQPEAIERAVEMAARGASEAEIEGRLGEMVRPAIPARVLSARRLPGWAERVGTAFRRGDEEVALHWATSWRAAEPGNARALLGLAYLRVSRGDLDGARALLGEAIDKAGSPLDDQTAFEMRRVEGLIFASEREVDRALRAFEDAIRLVRKTARPIEDVDELYLLRVRLLASLGRIRDAEHAIEEWSAWTRPAGGDETLRRLAIATLMLGRGETASAIQIVRQELDRRKDQDHPSRGRLIQTLALALLARDAFEDAERLTREAAQNAEKRGRSSPDLRHEHARALLGLGRFAEAEREFRKVLAGDPKRVDGAATRYELARCLSAQGRLDEAEVALDEALAELQSAHPFGSSLRPSMLYVKAHLQSLRGNNREAAALLREVLREEERAVGPHDPTLVPTLTALGDSLIESHEPVAAQPYLRRARRLAERAGDTIGLAVALGNLAAAEAMQRFPQAAHTARRALEAWSRTGRELAPARRAALEAIAAGGFP